MSGEPRPPTPSFETLAARARVDVDAAFTTKTWCSAASKLIDQVRQQVYRLLGFESPDRFD
jgi:hypothetical protein